MAAFLDGLLALGLDLRGKTCMLVEVVQVSGKFRLGGRCVCVVVNCVQSQGRMSSALLMLNGVVGSGVLLKSLLVDARMATKFASSFHAWPICALVWLQSTFVVCVTRENKLMMCDI